jgi:hypothetical protein
MKNFLENVLKRDYSVVHFDKLEDFKTLTDLFTGKTICKALEGNKKKVNIN